MGGPWEDAWVTELDERIARLFEGSPDEFVRARDELARSLRKDDGEASDRVKALRRSTVARMGRHEDEPRGH